VIECEFDYDADGKPTAIWTLPDSGMAEQTVYSYDHAERTVRIAKNTPAPEATAPAPVFEEGGGFTVSSTWVSVSVGEDSYEIAEAAAILTKYDSQNRPVEISYFGPEQQVLARKTLRWDSDGRLAGDELTLALGDLFGSGSMPHWETTYHYDSESRRVERRRSLGPDFEVRTTSTSDDHGNVAELIDSGKPATGLRHMRCEYRYDDRGNWIERVMSNRSDSGFEPQLKETRHIEY
jgi:YD repeat-containing protein